MGRRNPPRRQTGKIELPSSQLRIIAGNWRGRKLEFIAADGLRPTPDRVRETLFNWLQTAVPGANCLDLFSGSGALGLEALSRGAESATFIDRNNITARKLQDNLQRLKCQNAEVINADVLEWLEARQADLESRYDIVFMDPPFGKGLVTPCCERLEQRNLLRDKALIYIETETQSGMVDVPANWQQLREKQAGQVTYRLYSKEA
ncbi:MAG: 16S rRNA (guanine(966)-N(2))-methyltransferase RsmD [Neptuniibacter caesariensis]|uniref:Ribosomal RNA small subunit methyltransferase D n=1 Tax=Neptuniibacter caesariensis TaxID=207954 RepID=A0A2G6JAH6_NEPCE|nr:MAG: 16S rRNA (guanine(966)-N(2))-methyltransferase RsmD [Neptuniibacter caesariensis]